MTMTNGVNTGNWLEASKDRHLWLNVTDLETTKALYFSGYVPGLSRLTESASPTVEVGKSASNRAFPRALKRSVRRIREKEFDRQKEAFSGISPELLEPHKGRFVASRNGEIVDSDDDLTVLTGRFFREHGDVPVYITKVGEPIQATIKTPLFR